MRDFFNTPIFILGLPRSGTSMIAGALNICGAWKGSTVPADSETNPKGFFEHIVLREHITKKLLSSLGCDPLGVGKLPALDLHGEVPGLADIIQSILKKDGYKNDRPWLYKDAKLTLLWRYYTKAFPDARWIIVRRDEEGFVNSCLRTHFMKQHSEDKIFWKKFAQDYNRRIDSLKETNAPVFEISTPDIIAGDFSSLISLISNLGLTYREEELREFISPICWHGDTKKVTKLDV